MWNSKGFCDETTPSPKSIPYPNYLYMYIRVSYEFDIHTIKSKYSLQVLYRLKESDRIFPKSFWEAHYQGYIRVVSRQKVHYDALLTVGG